MGMVGRAHAWQRRCWAHDTYTNTIGHTARQTPLSRRWCLAVVFGAAASPHLACRRAFCGGYRGFWPPAVVSHRVLQKPGHMYDTRRRRLVEGCPAQSRGEAADETPGDRASRVFFRANSERRRQHCESMNGFTTDRWRSSGPLGAEWEHPRVSVFHKRRELGVITPRWKSIMRGLRSASSTEAGIAFSARPTGPRLGIPS